MIKKLELDWPLLEPLMRENFRVVFGGELSLNRDLYARLDAQGALLIVGDVRKGALVAYMIFVLMDSLHHWPEVHAQQVACYSARGPWPLGRLLREAEVLLRLRGVSMVAGADSGQIGPIYRRAGWRQQETQYIRDLKREPQS